MNTDFLMLLEVNRLLSTGKYYFYPEEDTLMIKSTLNDTLCFTIKYRVVGYTLEQNFDSLHTKAYKPKIKNSLYDCFVAINMSLGEMEL